MLWLSILISFLLGFSFISAVSIKFSWLEKIGASFLLGIGIQVLWMLIFDFIGLKINLTIVYLSSLLSIGLIWAYLVLLCKKNPKEVLFTYNPFVGKEWQKLNLPWIAVMFFVSYTLWAINEKCMFWPTFEFDAIAGYDLVGKVVAAEGSFHNSLFMSNGVSMYNMSLRAVYPPLASGSFAYAYMSGAEISKIMSSLYYMSFIVLLYGLLRRAGQTHLATAFTVLFVMYIPEMVAHAALSQTNMPQGVYTATAYLALYLWMKDKKLNAHYLFLSMLLFSVNSIIRSENILFSFVAGLAVLFHTLQERNRKNFINLLVFGFTVLFPFVLWTIFLKMNGMKPAAPGEGLSLSLAYDAEKFKQWWGYLFGFKEYPDGIVMNQNFYALIPWLYAFMLPVMIFFGTIRLYLSKNDVLKKAIARRAFSKDLALIFVSLAPFAIYSAFYYFINYDWDSIRNVLLFSYKRGLFGLMTVAACAVFLSEPLRYFFEFLQIFMFGKKKEHPAKDTLL